MKSVFDMLEWKGEKCSWDTFKSGDYVIVDYSDKYTEQPVSYYQSGETFKMEYGNGKQKDYGVIGEATDAIFPGLSVCRFCLYYGNGPRRRVYHPDRKSISHVCCH